MCELVGSEKKKKRQRQTPKSIFELKWQEDEFNELPFKEIHSSQNRGILENHVNKQIL